MIITVLKMLDSTVTRKGPLCSDVTYKISLPGKCNTVEGNDKTNEKIISSVMIHGASEEGANPKVHDLKK